MALCGLDSASLGLNFIFELVNLFLGGGQSFHEIGDTFIHIAVGGNEVSEVFQVESLHIL